MKYVVTPDLLSARFERVARRAAVVCATLGACALAAALAFGPRSVSMDGGIAFVVPVGGLIAVGTLLTVRRWRNLVGWLCLVAGVLASFAIASGTYVELALDRSGSLPALAVVGWFSIWLGEAWVVVLLSIPLVFPDGRLPSRHWRPAAYLVGTLGVGLCVVSALDPDLDRWQFMPYNPLGVDGAGRLFAFLEGVTEPAVPGLIILSAAAMGVRFRRSRGVERLQLMWLAYATAIVALLLIVDSVVPDAMPPRASDVVFSVAYGMLPFALAVAILRYRLYDIERIIRRTIVYALLSAALAVVYASGAIVAGNIFSARRPDLVVAISTWRQPRCSGRFTTGFK